MIENTKMADGDKTVMYSDDTYGFEMLITQHADGTATLKWQDGVANEFSETYPDLPVTLLRYAALLRCGADDWVTCFVDSPDEFTVKAQEYLRANDTDKVDEFLRAAVSR